MRVLAVNVGSSSLKLAVFEGEDCLERRHVERVRDPVRAFEDAIRELEPPDAVGHRLVHGGPAITAPLRVDADTRRSLSALERFAPLHMPAELAVLDGVAARWPSVPEVVCFDTAFHRTMPEIAERLPLPRGLFDEGVRRYGFHGLSYEYVVESIGAERLGRAVLMHLGSGASMVAVKDGRAIDTTMGFTPAGGLVMGTRSGDLDPGVLVHLMDHGYDARAIDAMVNKEAGLLGISGTTGDMKALLEASAADQRAALAVESFCASARKFVGALVTTLGGLDTLVFTGGIGEGAAPVRASICAGLGHLGVQLDAARNAASEARIDAATSPMTQGQLVRPANGPCAVLVVRTDEERMIARHTTRLLGPERSAR